MRPEHASASKWLGAHKLSRRQAVGLVSAASGSAWLAACGGRPGTRAGKAAPGGTQAGKPRAGGQLTLADTTEASSYDPSTMLAEVGRAMLFSNDSLLSYKAGSSVAYDDMEVIPWLVDRWEAPDAQNYTFHLHPSVNFANLPPVNGRALSSQDVKWSYEYISRTGAFAGKKLPPSTAASLLGGLDQIETPDDATVVVRFKEPYAPFLHYAASQWLPILAHEIYDADGDFSKRNIGTGPFQLDSTDSQQGSHWVHKKNQTYFQQGLPYIDTVQELVIEDQATQAAAFETKQLDLLNYEGLTLQTVQQVKQRLPQAIEYSYLQPQPYFFYINVRKPPLSDVRIRQAIAYSIDRDAYIRAFANGKGEWALAASIPGLFTEAETKQILKYDPAQAKQLVAQAGYPDGVPIEFIYGTFYGPVLQHILELFQSQVKPSGINITLKPLDHPTETARRRSGDYQLGIVPRGPGLPLDLDSMLYDAFYPGSSRNLQGVDDPKLTPLLVAQRQEADPAKRKQLWKQAVQYINTEPWAVALFYGTAFNLWRPRLKNYAPNMAAISSGLYLTQAWLAD
jgi:peptide/nickel transport system substrate-binding protein